MLPGHDQNLVDDDICKDIWNNTYMLFAGWEVRMVKNGDWGQDRGHSFLLYGPTLSR